MNLAEKILLSLSRKPTAEDYKEGNPEWTLDNALSVLTDAFPNFVNDIQGKTILDFGCSIGYQSVALALRGAKRVAGIDIQNDLLNKARDLAKKNNVSNKVEFIDAIDPRLEGVFDIAISQNSMEHFKDPSCVINIMKSAIKRNGSLYVTFGPPWYSPFGCHAGYFTWVPWVNILFREKTIMAVRSLFRDDGARKFEEVEGGLNKMTVKKFEGLIHEHGLITKYLKYNCVKRINVLGAIPYMRELFINQVNCVLCK